MCDLKTRLVIGSRKFTLCIICIYNVRKNCKYRENCFYKILLWKVGRKMKKKYKLIYVILILLIMVSCDNKGEETNPIYNIPPTNEDDPAQNITVGPDNEDGSSPETNDSHKDESEHSIFFQEPVVELDFNGLESDTDIAEADKLNINYKVFSHKMTKFCVNPENKTVYYINVGKDNYIYELRDEKSQLILAEKAECITLWKDDIYFIKKSYIQGKIDEKTEAGIIYKYSLSSGQISMVYDAKATTIVATEDGIYYGVVKILDKRGSGYSYMSQYYLLPFDKTEPQEVYDTETLQYKNYKIEGVLDEDGKHKGIIFVNQKDKSRTELLPLLHAGMSICGDNLYFSNGNYTILQRLNLATGEIAIFDKDDIVYDKEKYHSNFSPRIVLSYMTYIEVNNTLYLSSGSTEMYKEENDGTLSICSHPEVTTIDGFYNVRDLYTDGSKIYGILQNNNGREMFAEIIIEKKDSNSKEYVFQWKRLNDE